MKTFRTCKPTIGPLDAYEQTELGFVKYYCHVAMDF